MFWFGGASTATASACRGRRGCGCGRERRGRGVDGRGDRGCWRRRRARLCRLAVGEADQLVDQRAVVSVAFDAAILDLREDRANRIDHAEQRGRDFVRRLQQTVAQLREQVLTLVSHRLELRETEKAARSLDGVNRSKDARDHFAIGGVALEIDELPVETLEILVALDEKIVHDAFEFFLIEHVPSLLAPARTRRSFDAVLSSRSDRASIDERTASCVPQQSHGAPHSARSRRIQLSRPQRFGSPVANMKPLSSPVPGRNSRHA